MEETTLVKGINVCYEVEGKGDDLILVHGLGSSREIWRNTMKAASRLFKVYAIDLPGFGSSDKPDIQYGLPFYTDFMGSLLEELGIEKCALDGASMGGVIAASFASKYPDRVSKLVLTDPAGLTPLGTGLTRIPLIGDAAFWLMSRNKNMLRQLQEDSFYNPSMAHKTFADNGWDSMRNKAYREAILKNARYLSKVHPEYVESLRDIKARTLIIWGKDDRIMPVSDAHRYGELIRGSRVVLIDKCGHIPHVEKSDEYNKVLLAFLGEISMYYPEEA